MFSAADSSDRSQQGCRGSSESYQSAVRYTWNRFAAWSHGACGRADPVSMRQRFRVGRSGERRRSGARQVRWTTRTWRWHSVARRAMERGRRSSAMMAHPAGQRFRRRRRSWPHVMAYRRGGHGRGRARASGGRPNGDHEMLVDSIGTSGPVECEHHRSGPGGVGAVKSVGNRAAVFAGLRARYRGCEHPLWLDAVLSRYVEGGGDECSRRFVPSRRGPADDAALW